MSISILVEPSPGGYRAISGSPLDLTAEAESAAAAVAALRQKIGERLQNGAMIIEQTVGAQPSPIPVIPLSENPLFDGWLAAVEEYRSRQEAEELAGEEAR